MRYLVTNQQMKAADQYTMDRIGVPSAALMERAALAVTGEILARYRREDQIWVACGAGNNGADGLAIARMLSLKGYKATVLVADEEIQGTEEFRLQMKIVQNLGITVAAFQDFLPGRCDVLVDAVFGVGLSRPVIGIYKEFLEFLQSAGAGFTVAVDIPSGIHGDDGQVMGTALRADLTVTFGWEKRGSALYPGKAYSGQVVVKDIGFPLSAFSENPPEAYAYTAEDLAGIPGRPAYSNKGTFGRVLVIAGSVNMCGAAYLSALAAYRTGSGLVKVLTVEENRPMLQGLLPEAVLETFTPEEIERDRENGYEWLEGQCAWADAIVAGPGLGRGGYVRDLVEGVLTCAYVPVVLDADALNMIASNPELTAYYTDNMIITPHLGEMARLTGTGIDELKEDVAGAAAGYSGRYGITTVLKDAVTVVAQRDQRLYINASGNPILAAAGSGDVLTGIMAGLLAMGMDVGDSAAMAVYLHGLAGDAARADHGDRGLLAGELTGYISRILKKRKTPGNPAEGNINNG